jgi:hypothetical protein
MAISDWIKPKWKHSDPEVRLAAVKRMGPEPENEERLRALARTDADSRVRVAAVARIADEAFLREFAASPGECPARIAARERLVGIDRRLALESTDPEIQRAALSRLTDEDSLFEIARTAADPEIRFLAAERISDAERLCALTGQNCGPRVGLAVVDRLESEDLLRRVAETASGKKIKRAAREKLEALTGPSETPDAAERARVAGLCERMEALSDFVDPLRLRVEIEEILAEWNAGIPAGDSPLSERMDAARTTALRRERELAIREEVRAELVAVCVAAEALADARPDDIPAALDALRSRLSAADASATGILDDAVRAHYRNRFEAAAAAVAPPPEDERERREEAEAAARRSETAALDALCREAENLAAADAAEAAWDEIRNRWDAAEERAKREGAPFSPELIARMDAARRTRSERRASARAFREADRAEAAGRLLELVETLEAAARAEDRAGLEATVRRVRESWRALAPDLPDVKAELESRFEAARDEFFRRQREFWDRREWEWWANLNRKEELCRVAEALAEVDALEGVATALRDARREWRDIGPVSRENAAAIRERFEAACDRAARRCLDRKRALLETVRAVTAPLFSESVFESGSETGSETGDEAGTERAPDSTDDSSADATRALPPDFDWTGVADAVKAAQAEWNAIGILPGALEAEVRDEFRVRCDRYFAALREFHRDRDAERRENLDRKMALCAEAEALADSEEWAETAGRLKALQRRWREIGPVPREESDAVRERFRAACDAFFGRLKAREPEHIRAREDLIARAEERVAAAEAEDADMDAAARDLMALQKAWKTAPPVPPERMDALWARFHEPCNRFFERYKALLDQRKSEQAENEAAKTEMAERAESLADSEDWRETAEAIKALQRRWRETGPASRPVEQALWNRFRAACDRFFQNRNAWFEARRRDRETFRHRREEICAAAEALVLLVDPAAGKDDPPQSPDGASAVPDMAAAQLRAGLAFRDEVVVPGNFRATWSRAAAKIRELQAEWRRSDDGRAEAEEPLRRRFRVACDRVYAARPEDRVPAKPQPRNDEEARP